MNSKPQSSKPTSPWPWFLLAGVLVLLLAVLTLTTLQRIKLGRELMTESLTQHAALQVRALEDATRASMRRGMFRRTLLQTMVEEMVSQPHLRSMAILGPKGSIFAQSSKDKENPSTQSPLANLPTELVQSIEKRLPVERFLNTELVVGRPFRPFRRFGGRGRPLPPWACDITGEDASRPGPGPHAPGQPGRGMGMMGPGRRAGQMMGPGNPNRPGPPPNIEAYALVRLSTESFLEQRSIAMRQALLLAAVIFIAAATAAWGLWATARRRSKELERLRREVAESQHLAALGRLAGSVAHEVRNPLSALRGLVQFLAKGYDPGSKEAGYAQVAVEEVDRLERVVSGLLEYTRPQNPKLFPLDIRESLEGTLALMSDDPRTDGVEISLNAPAELPLVKADPDQLRQVIMNLLLNALEALNGRGRLEITARTGERDLAIDVADDGPGLPNGGDDIFDPFFSTKERGTGLGLAIASRIAQAHGGSLTAGSSSLGGALFTLKLPLDRN